jgi:heat shock protein HtpX
VSIKILNENKFQNMLASALILAGMALLLGAIGWVLAGSLGFFVALGAGTALILGAGHPANLTMKLVGARPVSYYQAPEIYEILRKLSQRAGFDRVPRLYFLPSAELNAFAAGKRKDPAIAITRGLLAHLNYRELTGVLAHELSHLRHNDLYVRNIANVASILTRGFALIGQILLLLSLPLILVGVYETPWMLVLLLLAAPLLSVFLQLALSRTREFAADMGAAVLTGDPRGLASALGQLERRQSGILAFLFGLPSRQKTEPMWTRSHPDTRERIKRLLSLVHEETESRPAEPVRTRLRPFQTAAISRPTPFHVR